MREKPEARAGDRSSRPGPYVPADESERDGAPADSAEGMSSVYMPSDGEPVEDRAGRGGGTGRLEELAERVRAGMEDFPDFPRPGILFRDVNPLFLDPDLFESITVALAAEAHGRGAEIIAGIESRGFLLATPVALSLSLPFVPVRKRGKLPGDTVWMEYDLEYGTEHLELQRDRVRDGARVVLVDDLLATGGTAAAAARLIERTGGVVAGVLFLVELADLNGRQMLGRYNITSILAL